MFKPVFYFVLAAFFSIPAITNADVRSDTTDIKPPETIHQAVFYLFDFLSKEEIELIKDSDETEFVGNAISGSGLGSWLINEWDLWSPGPLSTFFNRNGITNPPEMAEVILTSLHRYLNGRPMHINEQIREIRSFWEEQEEQLKQQQQDP